MPTILEEKNVSMLTGLKIFTKAEIESRYEIMMENYVKTVSIEAQTMLDMTRREILPAVERYTKELSDTLAAKLAVIPGLPSRYETGAITKLSTLADQIDAQAGELEQAVLHLKTITSVTESAFYIRDAMFVAHGGASRGVRRGGDRNRRTLLALPDLWGFALRRPVRTKHSNKTQILF